ncbi:hypothetical protein [Gordonia sp. UCD-TK1]|uniref:hypothetical protein n=2 Tax=Gordonia sp. UCD-TK1 TaxID=1857893 RepID=UPI001586DD8A|nr:hypothetical protein [Gordonia sp. UCD-TK1]
MSSDPAEAAAEKVCERFVDPRDRIVALAAAREALKPLREMLSEAIQVARSGTVGSPPHVDGVTESEALDIMATALIAADKYLYERVRMMRLATCRCGWEEPIYDRDATALHAAHVVAAIRDSGYTVIALPEVDDPQANVWRINRDRTPTAPDGAHVRVRHWPAGTRIGAFGTEDMSPATALAAGAALIAAAKHTGDTQ